MEEKINVVVLKDGPIMIDGETIIVNIDGSKVESKKCFLCRCGASKNKPYCDGSHKSVDFKD